MDYASTPVTQLSVRPCIAELLRTGHHPAELILRVERVVEVPIILTPAQPDNATTSSRPSCSLIAPSTDAKDQTPTCRTYRIFLTDGELVIQALLMRDLHYFVSTGEVEPGALLQLERFEVRKAKRISYGDSYDSDKEEDQGQVTFLAVERFTTVDSGVELEQVYRGIERDMPVLKTKTMDKKRTRDDLDDFDDFNDLDDLSDLNDLEELEANEPSPAKKLQCTRSSFSVNNDAIEDTPSNEQIEDLLRSDDSFSIFEERNTSTPDPRVKEARKSPLKYIVAKSPLEAKKSIPLSPAASPATNILPFPNSFPTPAKSPRKRFILPAVPSQTPPIDRPLNLLTLYALLHPPRPLPKRNYILDIFCVISWISPTTTDRRNMPLKRDLRIIDSTFNRSEHSQNPKLELGVCLSVFVDAERFRPAVGTVALLRSLKTHEWEGVSLNAYQKDCGGKEWFISDRKKLEGLGYDVAGMRKWWDESNVKREMERKAEEERKRLEEEEKK